MSCPDRRHANHLVKLADLPRRSLAYLVGSLGWRAGADSAIGGELDTAFVLPGIFSDDHPAPSASPDAFHVSFPDGAVIEYEPESGSLTVSGIKTADVTASDAITATVPLVLVKASTRITLDTPEVVCTNKLTTATLEVQKGGKMSGNIEHGGGTFKSNGVQVDEHDHGGVKRGDDRTVGTK